MDTLVQGWEPLTRGAGHPLAALAGAPLPGGPAAVRLGFSNRVGARAFALLAPDGRSLVLGLHHHGPIPSHNWIEVMSTDLRPGEEGPVFRLLAQVVPPGGHIMVEYESTARHPTERALAAAVPPPLSPLGLLLHSAGFTAGFKDWYISEGGSEGPRKLQAFRPLNQEHLRGKSEAMAREVAAYLRSNREGEQHRLARERARELVALLPPEAREQVEAAL